MEYVFKDFQEAHLIRSGPLLSTTLTPLAPAHAPNRLRDFYRSSNSSSIQHDIRIGLVSHANTELRFTKTEGNTWVELYVAYWKALEDILAAEDTPKPSWGRVYESWKEVTNVMIRGYSTAGFESWSIPCLYVAARYLRVFAIKADESAQSKGIAGISTVMQDDIAGDWGKNEKLEDAARVINRIFTLCISDRYVVCSYVGVGVISSDQMLSSGTGLLWLNLGNGGFITLPTCCSRLISR